MCLLNVLASTGTCHWSLPLGACASALEPALATYCSPKLPARVGWELRAEEVREALEQYEGVRSYMRDTGESLQLLLSRVADAALLPVCALACMLSSTLPPPVSPLGANDAEIKMAITGLVLHRISKFVASIMGEPGALGGWGGLLASVTHNSSGPSGAHVSALYSHKQFLLAPNAWRRPLVQPAPPGRRHRRRHPAPDRPRARGLDCRCMPLVTCGHNLPSLKNSCFFSWWPSSGKTTACLLLTPLGLPPCRLSQGSPAALPPLSFARRTRATGSMSRWQRSPAP